jgi:hypothetical protein
MHTFEAPPWWLALVAEKTAERGIKRRLLDDLQRLGVEIDEPALGRAIRGERVQIEVARRLSDLLQIPPPIFLPDTEADARAIVAELAIRAGIAPKIAEIRAGVAAEETARQPTSVESKDGSRRSTQRKRRRVAGPRSTTT